ncbi:hypothetical protein WIT60_16025 [Aquabacterium sp. G14]|uniref:hypothetical protein n=1 Tax=Aquabacterium sp. G14 TaxID=3130164 RepID=UPI0030A295F0
MKDFIKMCFWASLAFFLFVAIIELLGSSSYFSLPRQLAEKKVGPAPQPTVQELIPLGYPIQKPGEDYSNSILGQFNRRMLSLEQASFLLKHREPWEQKVSALEEEYVTKSKLLAGLLMLPCLWMFARASKRWWSRSLKKFVKSIIDTKLSRSDPGEGSLRQAIENISNQRRLKKQQEEFQQMESLLKNGLITQDQFDEKKAVIISKVQRVMQETQPHQ